MVPTDPEGKVDAFIDDKIVVVLYEKSNWFRLAFCIPPSIHKMSRPIKKSEPINRPDFMDFNKMWEEGRLEEIKVIIGWDLDTRKITVRLMDDK